MENFRDFLGNDLDDCIGQAMAYYGCGRDSLEIELIQEAKSGIFGIIGARKAKIRARRAFVREKVANMLNSSDALNMGNSQGKKKSKNAQQGQIQGSPGQTRENAASAQNQRSVSHAGESKATKEDKIDRNTKIEKTRPQRPANIKRSDAGEKLRTSTDAPGRPVDSGADNSPKKKEKLRETIAYNTPSEPIAAETPEMFAVEDGDYNASDLESASWPLLPLSELDGDLLRKRSIEIVGHILEPIAGRPLQIDMELGQRSVRIHVDWEGDAGLLIGRDGHTMAAAQYLASRILSRVMKSVVHVQLDIGDYRARQEDKLRELAQSLAEKAASMGKPLSTGPLSAYHRRLVHLSLQDNEAVQTRSIGEGPVKRVLISPRRSCQP